MSELVGRRAELRVFEQDLVTLARGEAGVVVVAGEPGIGKTRLLGELLDDAEQRGYLALSGSGGELEADLPFAVIADALDPYVATLQPVGMGVGPRARGPAPSRGRVVLAGVGGPGGPNPA